MSQTFELNNYSIVVSLNDRTIYFKVVDQVSFYQYEGNVDPKELRLSNELADIHKIIIKCFQGEYGYVVTITVNSGMMKLVFNALVGGFFKMNFEVFLKEKVMSNDGQLTINFNRLEQKLTAGLQKLMERCEQLEQMILKKNEELLDLTNKLSYAHINFCYSGHPSTEHFVAVNTKEITRFNGTQAGCAWRFDLINDLYQLEQLTINYFRVADFATAKMKSRSLKTLTIQNHAEGNFNSVKGIEEMPNLQSLTIVNAPNLTNIPTVLKSYDSKINHIVIKSCVGVNVVELQTYCQTNNIKLEIS